MAFKKATYLFFAVFFLMTKIGLAFNIHYCGGSIADISHIFEGRQGCGMQEMTKPVSPCEMLQKKSCCDDEVLVIQNDDKNPLVNELELSEVKLLAVLGFAAFFDLPELPSGDHYNEIPYKSNAHAPPLYKLYCCYTFYS